jgi:hypothetical protein
MVTALAFALLTQQGTSANAPQGGPLPVWGSDIRVNAPEFPTPYRSVQRNFAMVANPANPQMLLTGYDNQRDAYIRSGYAVSTDGGQSWTNGAFLDLWDSDKLPVGDINVGFDRYGTGYYSGFAQAQGGQESGVFMLTTTNGLDWSTPVPIVRSDGQVYRYRVRFVIDNSTASPYTDRITAFWNVNSLAPPYFLGLKSHFSTDGGITWSSDVQVSDPQWTYDTGTNVAIAPNGTIYASWLHLDENDFRRDHHLLVDRSTDGGVTWGTDHIISGEPIRSIGRPDFMGHELVLVADDKCSIMRIFNFPFIATSPHNSDTVYAVWNDSRWDSTELSCGDVTRHSDIAFSRSTDGGATWSTPARINDDTQGNGIDQFQPSIAVRADGTIGITWLDRRDDAPDHYFYDLYYAQSTDGGITWSPNQRVSDATNDPDPVIDYKSVDDLGYKNSLVFVQDRVIPSWIRTIDGTFNGDYHIDRGLLPVLSATPTPMPPSATATATPTACTLSFSDVLPENPFYANIRCLACRGIISGYSNGTFRPGADITRGQISKMVSNAAGFQEPVGGQTYEDVPPSHTFYTEIMRLSNGGVMSGYPCGNPEPCVPPDNRPYFRPGNNATRGQLSKIVSNAAQINDPVTGQFYADVPTNHTFYLEIMRLTGRGVMSGYPCGTVPHEPCDGEQRPYFRPGNNVTRGQASKIVANTFFPGCVTP